MSDLQEKGFPPPFILSPGSFSAPHHPVSQHNYLTSRKKLVERAQGTEKTNQQNETYAPEPTNTAGKSGPRALS